MIFSLFHKTESAGTVFKIKRSCRWPLLLQTETNYAPPICLPVRRKQPGPQNAECARQNTFSGENKMNITLTLNGKQITDLIPDDMVLLDFCRRHSCFSVKRGCETGNCGACTVLMDGKPVLSCGIPAGRAQGHRIDTLEGLQDEAEEFIDYIAAQGADQCGFCNPGLVVNTIALLREKPDPTREEIRVWLEGNLCRCSGYEGQVRGVENYLNHKYGRPLTGACARVHRRDDGPSV